MRDAHNILSLFNIDTCSWNAILLQWDQSFGECWTMWQNMMCVSGC